MGPYLNNVPLESRLIFLTRYIGRGKKNMGPDSLAWIEKSIPNEDNLSVEYSYRVETLWIHMREEC